jgi:DNA-binding XRE family transcriptional regulator
MPLLEIVLDGKVIERRTLTTEQFLREQLGLRLKSYRLDAGLTQAVLAERAGVSRQTVVGIERGETDPRYTTLVRIIKALEIPNLHEPFETLFLKLDDLDFEATDAEEGQ